MSIPVARTVRPGARVVLLLVAAWLAVPVLAQPVAPHPLRPYFDDAGLRLRPTARWDAGSPSPVSLVDIGAEGPLQRRRTALRVRFESATRAMRSLGVEADDCSSLVRSSTRWRADEPGGSERMEVSVSLALSCRFF